jgi:hypothetical protein
MVVTAVMTALCTGGVAFYVRFLFALCKECTHRRICYLVALQPDSVKHVIPETREEEISILRAA